tara:strand:- start:61 stop:690 length:630 start_codon:yes stop_codon:yes gene_type:complete
MIDLYTWTTPNGRKVSILLEELGVDYKVFPINIAQGEQHAPDFLAISPNNRIPAIVDHDNGLSLMETGAIMLYLAEKYDRFMPTDPRAKATAIEWLMWQMGGLGPMLGQVHHFVHYNPDKSEYSSERYSTEAHRLYGVLEKRIAGRDYIVDDYSIVDMACWPWISRYEWQKIDLAQYPNVRAWYKRILQREAVQRGYHVPKNVGEIPAG